LQKIGIILLICFFTASCSVTRKERTNVNDKLNRTFSDNTLESIKYQNITSNSFFIQKAEIILLTKNGKERFIANIKFEKPDKYLISIKNITGIEGARIYINEDSILVNDRINKKLYFGNSYNLKKKFGLTIDLIPLIFGDIVLDKNCEKKKINC